MVFRCPAPGRPRDFESSKSHQEPPQIHGSKPASLSPSGSLVANRKHYVYVDNLGVFDSCPDSVARSLQELDDVFKGPNLLLHPGEVSATVAKALGTWVHCDKLCSSLTSTRLHKVRAGIRALLKRRKVSGQLLEIVVSHATFCALSSRGLLSLFHSVFAFVQANYYTPTSLWQSAKDELRAFCGLIVF